MALAPATKRKKIRQFIDYKSPKPYNMIIIKNYIIISKTELQNKINAAVAKEKQIGDNNLENLKYFNKYLFRQLKNTEDLLKHYKETSLDFVKGKDTLL
jgi:hypothetical protein